MTQFQSTIGLSLPSTALNPLFEWNLLLVLFCQRLRQNRSSEMSAKRGVDFLKSIAEYYGKTAGHDALTNVVCVAGNIGIRQLYLFYKTTPHVN